MLTVRQKLERLKIQLDSDKLLPGQEVIKDKWQQGFIQTCCDQMEFRGEGSFTEKQFNRIHIIYDEYF